MAKRNRQSKLLFLDEKTRTFFMVLDMSGENEVVISSEKTSIHNDLCLAQDARDSIKEWADNNKKNELANVIDTFLKDDNYNNDAWGYLDLIMYQHIVTMHEACARTYAFDDETDYINKDGIYGYVLKKRMQHSYTNTETYLSGYFFVTIPTLKKAQNSK